ncbi:EAL domain-containing response regulator [Pseudomonas sp. P9_35]|uniref:EAL domain-containing response regulator n=1 Tax=unclassified Pseudomonas TaxID=196821 RepID=UPI002A360F8D|nr:MULTISPECIES: EAL domain-containing response regulator [unclassified Pseudomonas]WPN65656.1 EAL domain-containing response regulator [Pseudomonas sp. P9_32]WPN71407.1 EAL domain-containing response regulator [Pseudomonas sp. P9_35]
MDTLSVIVLEDHFAQRVLAVEQLRSLGCVDVLAAQDGGSALQLLRTQGPVDIVVCDLQMPGMDGLEFLRHASQEGLIHAVILYSAVDAELRRAVQQMAHWQGLLVLGDMGKPAQLQVLRPMLEAYLAHQQPKATALSRTPEPLGMDDIRRGVRDAEFVAFYQPKFRLDTKTCSGAEVLVRWRHPDRGTLAPAAFLSALESDGLLDEVFFQLLEQGMKLQKQLLEQGESLELAFNLSPAQLGSSEIVGNIKQALEDHQIPSSLLTIEITETGLVEASATCLENLVRLRMMGCNLAIDDFGAGYSSLQRLCELPFNQIKLDGHFTRALMSQPRCRAVVRASLALAQSLDMSLVVEGIETEEQLLMLLEMQCALGQGYWYARPMGEADFLGWIKAAGLAL